MKTLKLLAACLVFAIAASATEEKSPEARAVGWDDLKMPFEFEDPFEALSDEQLMDLGIIARVRGLAARGKGDAVSDGMQKEADEALAKLAAQKVDVEGLFAKREEITRLRTEKASAVDPKLEGVLIELSGFVLPLEYEDKKVTEFLLVPWVGACIHTPPPPPNQIVHVTPAAPFETKGMFEAITVTGTMKIENLSKELFLVDGKADINFSYNLPGAKIRKYKKE